LGAQGKIDRTGGGSDFDEDVPAVGKMSEMFAFARAKTYPFGARSSIWVIGDPPRRSILLEEYGQHHSSA